MWHRKINFRFKLVGLFLILLLLLPVFTACGDNGKTSTLTTSTPSTSTPTAPVTTQTATVTPTATPSGPVKIGAMTCWSGPCAISGVVLGDPVIKLVEWQVKQEGGIIGGRDLKVIRYDSRGSVAEAQAGALKLLLDEKVSAITWGGSNPTEFDAVSDYAEANEVPFISFGEVKNLAEKKFSVCAMIPSDTTVGIFVDIASKLIKPKKAALLCLDVADIRDRNPKIKSGLAASGAEIVYEDYVSMDTTDFSSHLTKIKYLNPDLLIVDFSSINAQYLTIAKQITELGGWGSIKVVTNYPGNVAVGKPGAEGWYILTVWAPGQPDPGSIKFETDFQTVNGKAPTVTQVYFYNCLWTAIYAIKMAGTDSDRVAIAQALRSGNLQWDTPMGTAHFTTEGQSGLAPFVSHVEEGKMVPVALPK